MNDGVPRAHRFVPGMARAGMIVRPVLESEEDFVDACTIDVAKLIINLRLSSPNGWSEFHAPTYHVTIERWDDLLPPQDLARRTRVIFGSFPTRPISETGTTPARYFYVDEREYVLVSPAARVLFALEPGPHELLGRYGLLESILELSDGIEFGVALLDEAGAERELMRRTLDKTVRDATAAQFDLDFVAGPGDRLVISTSNLAGHTADYDLQYLEKIEIR